MPDISQPTTTDTVAALSDLMTDLADVIRGYDTMKDRAEPDLAPLVDRLHAMHRSHAAGIAEYLERMGGRPENAGSMMGAVHVAVATARDWFGALDASAREEILRGEDRLADSYTKAIAAVQGDPDLSRLLDEQRAAIRHTVIDG
jgi:uncharacterized protein (TIGR02284 family)